MQLGIKVRDTITGFTGVVTGHVRYLTGCNQALVQPQAKDGSDFKDPHWFDEQRIERVDDSIVVLNNGITPGFDVPAPKR